MKKKMIALLAGALLMLGAGNAMAYFDDYDLIRVVYNSSTGDEAVTSLGNITTLLHSADAAGSAGYSVGGGAGVAFTGVTNLGASADANLHVAYIAANFNSLSDNQQWAAATGTAVGNPGVYASQNTALYNTFITNYQTKGLATSSPATLTGNKSTAYSYQAMLVPDGAAGSIGSFIWSLNGEASLATLASAPVQMGLYYWADAANDGTSTQLQYNILTNTDGSTTIVGTQATPIPAAAYLLGSGLMGLFGLRRKQRA